MNFFQGIILIKKIQMNVAKIQKKNLYICLTTLNSYEENFSKI